MLAFLRSLRSASYRLGLPAVRQKDGTLWEKPPAPVSNSATTSAGRSAVPLKADLAPAEIISVTEKRVNVSYRGEHACHASPVEPKCYIITCAAIASCR